MDQQLSQLAQLLGQSRYRQADAALRRVIPRGGGGVPGAGPEARAAAIWALGLFHEGKVVPELVQAFESRLTDLNPLLGEEDYRVRSMSAVGIGRMKAKEGLDSLQMFWGGKPSLERVTNSCGWAIGQITGEAIPPAGTVDVLAHDWFLTPFEQSRP
jgi:hypothetical protein